MLRTVPVRRAPFTLLVSHVGLALEYALEIVCPAWHPGAEKLVQAVSLLADEGVTAVEIGIDSPDYFNCKDGYELECLLNELSNCGVRVHSIHAPFGPSCDVSSPDDEVHERGVDSLLDAIEMASVLEAPIVIMHASDVISNGCTGRMERARGVLREMSVVAKETGVRLALENLPPGYLTHTPAQITELLGGTSTDSVGLCFDTGHANLSGHFKEYAEALLPLSITTHLHDNNGAADQHQFPGLGTIDWAQFGRIYRRLGSSASIMLECAPPEKVNWFQAFQQLRVAMGD